MWVFKWITQYFWDQAISTLKISWVITVFIIVFSFLNKAGCMISSLDIETTTKDTINYAFVIIDIIAVVISLGHSFTALLRATKYQD